MKLVLCLFLCLQISCSSDARKVMAPNDEDKPIPSQMPTEPIPEIPDDQKDSSYFYFAEQEEAILTDLNSLDEASRKNSRYLLCSDQLNAFGKKNSDVCKLGVSKLLNSISNERQLISGKEVGAEGSIVRFDLRDIGLSSKDWRLIENLDPFKFRSETVRGKTIRFLTQSVRPFMFANNAAEVMLVKAYYKLQNIPDTLALFEAQIGVDAQRDFNQRDVGLVLIGMNESVITSNRQHRLMRRLEGFDGAYWCTYDTNDKNIEPILINGQLVNQKNLLEAPFPVEVRSNKTFVSDAGECIYTKPNGMLGFALFAADGSRADFAPTNIVQDTGSAGRGLSGTIQNARSCFRCHAGGFVPARDSVAAQIQQSTGFNAADKQKARLFFKGPDAGLAAIRNDNAAYLKVMLNLGIFDASEDPINAIVDRLRLEQNAKQVAATLGISEEELLVGLRSSTGATSIMGSLLQPSGTVNFQQLIDGLPVLIVDMNLFKDDE